MEKLVINIKDILVVFFCFLAQVKTKEKQNDNKINSGDIKVQLDNEEK